MLSISEFKKVYEEIKIYSSRENDITDKDILKNIFIDFFSNRFKDSSSIFLKFDWRAISKVLFTDGLLKFF
jgi:hypothetical protein